MSVIKNNPFRILGVFANATSSAIAGRSMQMLAKLRTGLSAETPESLDSLCGTIERTPENISAARAALQRPADRLEHALFWFTSADAIDTTALDAIAKGNLRLAEDIWKASPESVSACHNLAVLLLATDRTVEAQAAADRLSADRPRELCTLLAPGISMSSQELTALYRRLAPATPPPLHTAASEVIEAAPPPRRPKPRPAVSIRTAAEGKPSTLSPLSRYAAPSTEKEASKPETAIMADEPERPDSIKSTIEYLNRCIGRLSDAKPSIEECSRFFDDADSGMSRLRNELERKDKAAYQSWADGCANHLMAALSRLGKYRKGEPKTARAMSLLSKCKSWGLSPAVEKSVNDHIARLYASKNDDTTTVIVICAVVFFIFLLRACS